MPRPAASSPALVMRKPDESLLKLSSSIDDELFRFRCALSEPMLLRMENDMDGLPCVLDGGANTVSASPGCSAQAAGRLSRAQVLHDAPEVGVEPTQHP